LELEEVELVVLIQYFQQLHLKVVVEQERLQLVLVNLEVQVVVL
jgi:hypothetical protein